MRGLALLLAGLMPLAAHAQEATRAEGLAAWDRIYAVASHPRCTNCHVGDSGRPRWAALGYGADPAHGMNIRAGDSRIGAETIPCRTCHISTDRANLIPHAAPQVADAWRLPPVALEWQGKASAEICAKLRDPDRNDGFDIAGLAAHVRESAFVAWGFDPGAGRVAAPGDPETLARDIEIWGAAGAPCTQ